MHEVERKRLKKRGEKVCVSILTRTYIFENNNTFLNRVKLIKIKLKSGSDY